MTRRKFIPFDAEVVAKEFLALPYQDRSDLRYAMWNFQNDSGIGYSVKSYRDGLMMLKGSGQGRCLWFFKSGQELVALLIYKKESQKVDGQSLATALARMKAYKELNP